MANKKQLDKLLKEGVSNWNEWRRQNPREYVDLREAFLMEKNLSKIDLIGANLQGAYLRRANLKKAHLNQAHLEGANLWEAHMEEAALIGASLEGADLHKAHLDGAFLYEAHLEGADLRATNLKGAKLCWTHLEGADLREAHLEGADLQWAVLEGRLVPSDDLQRIQDGDKSFPETLSPADLRSAFFDSATNLRDITLGNREYGFVPLADVHWGGVNLAGINWDSVTILGDEREVHQFRRGGFNERAQLVAFQQAIRANHQLAAVLQDQAMLGEADHFAHRAQVLHRKVLQLQLLLHVASLWEKIHKTLVWESVVEIGQDIMKPWHWLSLQGTRLWKFAVMKPWHWLSLQGTRLWKFAVKNIPGPMAMVGSFMFIVLVCFMLVPVVLVGLFMFILLNTPLEKRVLEVGRWIMALGKSALEAGWWIMAWLWHRLFELGTLLYKLGGLIFVLFLGVLAGYGYRPERTFFWYLSVVTGFALAYHGFYNVQSSEAFFLSLTSFHGRGFFPGSELANSPVRFPAAIEAVVGLFIEISFIAAFTRRFFGK